MAEPLTARQQQLLGRLARSQPWVWAAGAALVVASSAYLVWSVRQFHPRANPALVTTFDAPLVRPIAQGYARLELRLARFEPRTASELRLAHGLRRTQRFSAGLLILATRALLGVLGGLLGLATLTVAAERRRLLAIVARLRAQPAPPPAAPPHPD
jgi:hypothetical protein